MALALRSTDSTPLLPGVAPAIEPWMSIGRLPSQSQIMMPSMRGASADDALIEFHSPLPPAEAESAWQASQRRRASNSSVDGSDDDWEAGQGERHQHKAGEVTGTPSSTPQHPPATPVLIGRMPTQNEVDWEVLLTLQPLPPRFCPSAANLKLPKQRVTICAV